MRNIARISLSDLILLCAGIVALVGCKSQTPTANLKAKPSLNLVGEYFQGGGYGGPVIKLLADGRYVFTITSDYEATKESGGNYTVTDGLLVLSPDYSINSAADMHYLPVKWGNRLYLLEQGKDELRFCNAINLGDEPVPAKLAYMRPFMMRTDDEKKPVTGKPQLPAPWNSYVLSRPVKGNVIRIQQGSPYGTATIDIGSADNIRVGMELVDIWMESVDNRRDNTFTVDSVTSHQATFKIAGTEVQNGDTISTHRSRSRWR